ncbi:MAG: LamG-like jellyroll fold domain-containing protein [Bacteroidales bacterium]|nr:T9SS type A sorting domain-containing protein [Bacteroidales bacterium]MDD2612436.1 T9SS type A sorting domain-containing protein [Bacteroidales bacterium]MDD3907320.1 T9SS type A sorting domain-containing protein [Bacteroidales bacterium]MDD4713032.1 T9SS type A sorting domain-containing protein [Bacteroidales bacterium]
MKYKIVFLLALIIRFLPIDAQNNALDFDGTDDYVEIPDNNALDLTTNYTLEAWVYFNTVPSSTQGIISKYQTESANGYTFRVVSGGKIDFDQVRTTSAVITAAQTWYHIAVVNNNGSRIIYVNGSQVSATGTPITNVANSDYVSIGSDFSSRYINGKIDEVRIWNDVRTVDEIRQNMYHKLTGSESNLVAYYNFDNTSGTTLTDITGHGHTGTLKRMEPSSDWVESSAFNTWLGSTSDWSSTSNWYRGSVPVASDNVGIYSGVTYAPSLSSTGNCGNLYVGSGSSLSIEPVGNLSVSGTLTNNGTVTIKSDNTGTGSLTLGNTTTATVTATVERYMAANAWHLITPPVSGQTIGTFLTANTTIKSNPDNSSQKALKDYNESTNTWNGLTYTTSTTDLLSLGKGYAVWPSSAGVVSYTGTLPTGTQTISVTRTNDHGWNCIGNPYTSSIAINTAAGTSNFINTNSTKLENSYGAIYVWNPANESYSIFSLGDETAYYLPVGQAFFVKAKTSGTTQVSFTSAMQQHQPGATFRSATAERPEIDIDATMNGKKSMAKVRFIENATRGLDFGYDAGAFKTGFDVYTKLVEDNGVDFAIQSLPVDPGNGYVIPVGLETSESGTLKLSLTPINLPAGCTMAFEDTQLGTSTEIDESTKTLTVEVTSGTTLERFYLNVNKSSTSMEEISSNLTVTSSEGVITIHGAVKDDATATLYDLQGRFLTTVLLSGSINRIRTNSLTDGIYLLQLKQPGNVRNLKVILKK